jgi:putrescine transport system substrate-binding protein
VRPGSGRSLAAAAAASCLAVLLGACGGAGSPGAASGRLTEKPIVHFANFAEEIGSETLAQFTRETGIEVIYDVYETNHALDAKLMAGRTGYDVVVPGSNFLENQLKAEVYQPLDRTQLPNWKHLDPDILRRIERNDPGNRHSVPYLYGTHALGYNVDLVRAALGREPPDSWSLLFAPEHARRLQRCGIEVPDTPWILVRHALLYLGRDPNSEDAQDLDDAMKALDEIRPYLRDVTSALRIGDYAEGEVCVFAVPSADVRLARDQALQAKTGAELRYVIPEEGGLLWFDMLAIPADAPHPGNAHKLIDFLLRPDVIAKVTEATYLANANRGADALVPPALRQDPLIYPDDAALERLHAVTAYSSQYARNQSRAFTRFKTAR